MALKKFLWLKKLKILFCGLNLMVKKLLEAFAKKNKNESKEFKIDKNN